MKVRKGGVKKIRGRSGVEHCFYCKFETNSPKATQLLRSSISHQKENSKAAWHDANTFVEHQMK